MTQTPQATASPLPQNVGELIQATRDPNWKARWDAVNALGELEDPRAIPALVERALHDENSHPRWRSLWALSAIERAGNTAKPLFLVALRDPDPVVVRNSAIALAFFGQSEARPELLRGLNDADNYRRWEAVFSIKEVPSPEVVSALVRKLDPAAEPAADVRAEAALALGTIGGQETIPNLLDSLRSDPSPAVRTRAALALSRVGGAWLVPGLEEALSVESDAQVKEFLRDAIAELRKRG